MSIDEEVSAAAGDFRSDTFTTPTRAMREAAMNASTGDSVYEEDSTTAELEAKVADLTQKEAAMYVPSGTMSNQIALRLHLYQPPHSILCDYRAHVYTAEAAGLAVLSQAMVTPVRPSNGVYLTLEDVEKSVILGDNIHTAPTKVISLENTLGGTIMPISEIARISEFARNHDIKMHLDGARLWNASAETGISMAEYCSYFDTVSLCLSKGLGAPVGSILVGTKTIIQKGRWIRKQQGGGIRQAGWLAAAAMVAIDQVWPTMKATHQKAKGLAQYLKSRGITTQLPVDTSFLFIDSKRSNLNTTILVEEAAKLGIKLWDERIVFHHQIRDSDVERLKQAFDIAIEKSLAQPTYASANGGAYRNTDMNDQL